MAKSGRKNKPGDSLWQCGTGQAVKHLPNPDKPGIFMCGESGSFEARVVACLEAIVVELRRLNAAKKRADRIPFFRTKDVPVYGAEPGPPITPELSE